MWWIATWKYATSNFRYGIMYITELIALGKIKTIIPLPASNGLNSNTAARL